MAEEQKKSQKEFSSCCQGKPFVDMIQKMGETKNAGAPFNCAEMMSMCCGFGEKKEASKENPIPNP